MLVRADIRHGVDASLMPEEGDFRAVGKGKEIGRDSHINRG